MSGVVRKISLPRRFVCDLMHASKDVPLVSLKRTFNIARLAAARAAHPSKPGWPVIFAKAFCIVARDQPILRTLYIKWPTPHLYELPNSTVMIAIAPRGAGEDCVFPERLGTADEIPLTVADSIIRQAKDQPLGETRFIRRILAITRLPTPLRRLVWAIGLNVARQRAKFFGTLGITSVAGFGPGELYAISPGPYLLSYGMVSLGGSIDVILRWDHRVADAEIITHLLTQLELVLNTVIVDELLADLPEREHSRIALVAV